MNVKSQDGWIWWLSIWYSIVNNIYYITMLFSHSNKKTNELNQYYFLHLPRQMRRSSRWCVKEKKERRERKWLGFFGKRHREKERKRASSVYSHGTLNGTELEGRCGALPTWTVRLGIWSVADWQ
jgi:hypothetical protein